jgi:uncharacterized coiled-coil DUF342 family protein
MLTDNFQQTLYAAITGLFAGLVIKFANKLLDGRRERFDEHIQLRKELREELDAVLERVDKLQEELDMWKQKYFDQVVLTNELKSDILKLTHKLEEYKNNSGAFSTTDGDII